MSAGCWCDVGSQRLALCHSVWCKLEGSLPSRCAMRPGGFAAWLRQPPWQHVLHCLGGVAGYTYAPILLCLPKRRWEWEDLEPYVQDLRGPGQTAEALLLKYTRASQAKPTDPVTYSMR